VAVEHFDLDGGRAGVGFKNSVTPMNAIDVLAILALQSLLLHNGVPAPIDGCMFGMHFRLIACRSSAETAEMLMGDFLSPWKDTPNRSRLVVTGVQGFHARPLHRLTRYGHGGFASGLDLGASGGCPGSVRSGSICPLAFVQNPRLPVRMWARGSNTHLPRNRQLGGVLDARDGSDCILDGVGERGGVGLSFQSIEVIESDRIGQGLRVGRTNTFVFEFFQTLAM